MYADHVTGSMQRALDEVGRRRKYQVEYNKKHKITPTSIQKPIREKLIDREEGEKAPWVFGSKEPIYDSLPHIEIDSMTPMEKKRLVKNLTTEMRVAAQDLNFELAAEIRDKIREISQ
jgi:excinuclease ABC subunit B